MTCRQPSCLSQRSVSGFTSAKFSDSLGIHFVARGGACAAAGASARVAIEVRRKSRRVAGMAISLARRLFLRLLEGYHHVLGPFSRAKTGRPVRAAWLADCPL